MYTHIMVPVDLAHTETLGKALQTAADLAKHYSCPVTYVGVTMSAPTSVAHNPEEFAAKLETFVSPEELSALQSTLGQYWLERLRYFPGDRIAP